MRKIIASLLLVIAASSAMAQQYLIPVKVWAYGQENAPKTDDIKQTIQNLNQLNAQNKTGFQYYLLDYEFVNKKKFDNFGFYGQMPWQSMTRHDKNILNIALVGRLKKGGHDNKDVNYSGVCFGPTGSVVVAMRDDPSVVTHEVGHFLGLKHQFDIMDNIMSYNPKKQERRKFTDEQKQTMLDEAAKMKHSDKWKECASTLPDRYEPNDNLEMATPIKWDKMMGFTINGRVDGKGLLLESDVDILKFSISNKGTYNKPFICVDGPQIDLEVSILNSNKQEIDKTTVKTSNNGSQIFLKETKAGQYYIKVKPVNAQTKGEYNIGIFSSNNESLNITDEKNLRYWQ